MSKAIPEVSKYMSTSPHSVSGEQSLEKAEAIMREHRIRHLPVLQSGRLVGILSDRDVKLALSMAGTDPQRLKVQDVAREEVYEVSPHSKLDEVVSTMASKKVGSAVVMDNQKLVGIFTDIDALRALSELLHTRYHS